MKKLHSLLALTLVLCLFLLNCKEKENVIPQPNQPTGPTFSSMGELFDHLALKYKTVTISADSGASFYGNSGTRYIMSGHSLETVGGVPVTGNVQVQVCEYLRKGDMIFSKMLPISDNHSLLSGGALDIRASQFGQPLRLVSGATFTANIPQAGTPDSAMQFFRGDRVEGEQNNVNWRRLDGGQGKDNGVIVLDGDTLSLFSDSLTLCNADMFMANPDYKTFTITMSATGTNWLAADKVYCYALYANYNGMWPVSGYSNGVFNESHVPGIPVNFVAFTLIGGEFYGCTLGVTPENGKNYNMNLVKTSADAFKQHLNSL